MSAFGGRFDEPELTDQIDDDYDVMNDETFGQEVPTDEWEADQIAQELERAEAAVVAAAAEKSLLDYAASRLPISDDPLEFLKDDILQLVEEDDDIPIGILKKSSTGTKPLADIFAPGSPQTPFFQLNQGNRSIWSDSLLLPSVRPPQPTSPGIGMTGLLDRMHVSVDRVNGGGPFGLPTEQAPVLVKGAMTAEELEAELLGKPPATAPQKLPGPAVKSCAELEREMIESSRNAMAAAAVGMARPPVSTGSGFDMQQPMGMPGMPQIPNILMRPPPQHPLANPQVRAALMARWLAANPGVPPPVWFRMPPPPMMPPMPGAGFRPGTVTIRPGPNMPPMNFNNARMPQNMDPRAIGMMMQQQGHFRRPMPQNYPKRRLFDSPGRFGNDGHYEQRHRDRDRDRDYYHHNRDPFAGLMSRRERSWLIKIQTLQLHSENPYVDDYYWMMYRRRKMTSDGAIYKDSDHNDNFEHRVYVPPSFEGTLGKVQVLSANFPRQVLDLTASPSNVEKQQSIDEGSPRDSPPITKGGQPIIAGRRLKNILMEIENLYMMILEANDLTMIQGQSGLAGMEENDREKAVARAKSLVQSVLSTLTTEDRIVSTLAIRKGRRLVAQLMPQCEKDDCLKIMQAILRNLPSLSKKEPHLDILGTIKLILDLKLMGTKEAGWSMMWETINVDAIENILKYKLGSALLLVLVQRSAIDGVKLSEGAAKSLERWASCVYSNVANNSNKDGPARIGSLEKSQGDQLSFWMKNVAGASIPTPVVDTIISSLVV